MDMAYLLVLFVIHHSYILIRWPAKIELARVARSCNFFVVFVHASPRITGQTLYVFFQVYSFSLRGYYIINVTRLLIVFIECIYFFLYLVSFFLFNSIIKYRIITSSPRGRYHIACTLRLPQIFHYGSSHWWV